ncbi:MAG TPA: hypothetical protein VHK69_13770 [Chitinophagaceae bacterium]|nr:hypothetical protein [Chitinophagaceae bacterium]
MKKGSVFLGLLLLAANSFAQSYQHRASLSAGTVMFGSGDIGGFGFRAGYDRNLRRGEGAAPLLLGVEVAADLGIRKVQAVNPPAGSGFNESFYQTANAYFFPKLTYYPMRRFLSGLFLSSGLTAGYTMQSSELAVSRQDLGPVVYRRSVLDTKSYWIVGYGVEAGYDIELASRVWIAPRFSLFNFSDGEFLNVLMIKAAYRF